jgi:hypothetical protein
LSSSRKIHCSRMSTNQESTTAQMSRILNFLLAIMSEITCNIVDDIDPLQLMEELEKGF